MLTHIEGKTTPHIINALAYLFSNGGAGSKMIERAMDEHPEYFQEELEDRRKWALVPESVIEAHTKESFEIGESFMPKLPMRGLMHYMMHPEDQPEYDAWSEEYWRLSPEREARLKICFNKHFGPYGLLR